MNIQYGTGGESDANPVSDAREARHAPSGKVEIDDISDPFDLRPQRDLVVRRVSREVLRRMIRIAVLLTGEALLGGVVLLVALVSNPDGQALGSTWLHFLPLVLLFGTSGQAAARTYGPAEERRRYLRSSIAAIASVLVLIAFGWIYPEFRLGMGEYVVLFAGLAVSYASVRFGVENLIRWVYRKDLGRRPTLIVGDPEAAWNIRMHLMASDDRQANVVGHLSPEPGMDPTALGGLDSLRDLLEEHDIRSVIVSAHLGAERLRKVVRCCLLHGATVSVVPAELSAIPCRFTSQQLAGWPLIELQMPRLHLLQIISKRTVDVVLALTAMVLLAPVALAIAVAIKRETPGPTHFRQERLGLGGRPFKIWKFRSMRTDAEQVLRQDPVLYRRYVDNDYKLPPDTDPRVTRVGRFLRRTSLDELPQLINVLLGEMSLVGPRPVVPDEIQHYGSDARIFLAVKPGVTGDWQVSGRSEIAYPERAQLDIDYILNWSLGRDLKILAGTAAAVFKRTGAH